MGCFKGEQTQFGKMGVIIILCMGIFRRGEYDASRNKGKERI